MKKWCFISIFLVFLGFFAFGDNQEEIDHLLFLPNSSNAFVNEKQAMNQLDNAAKYFLGRALVPGQIFVYGYAAVSSNDIEPINFSRNRALFVINELQKRGVPKELFSDPVGYGSVNLWGSNTTEQDKTPNRRVRILVDGSFVTPDTIKAAEPEVEAPRIDIDKKEIKPEKPARINSFTFPWEIFLILIPLALIFAALLLLSKNKKHSKPDTSKNRRDSAVPLAAASDTNKIVADTPKIVSSSITAPVSVNYTTVNLDDEIRFRAYQLFQWRNGQNGDDVGDWYAALRDVSGWYEADGYQVYPESGSWWARRASR